MSCLIVTCTQGPGTGPRPPLARYRPGMPTTPRAVLSWPLYAVVSVLCAVGGVVELVSRPHGATRVAGVIFLVLAVSNAAQAVIAYRRRQAGRGA